MRNSTRTLPVLVFLLLAFAASRFTPSSAQPTSWRQASRTTSAEWLRSPRATALADTIMAYQLPSGGWGKNHDWMKGGDRQEWLTAASTGIGATIDNGATHEELLFLARVVEARSATIPASTDVVSIRARVAFEAGLDYLLGMQYENGGYPQFYPPKSPTHYSRHITFNDGAMTSVLRLLRDVSDEVPPYASLNLSASLIRLSSYAYQRGLNCLLDCQIRRGDTLAVWCQQHDAETLLPAPARAYELPSYSGTGETVEILRLLMEEKDPSPEVIEAVDAAVLWLRTHALKGVRVEQFTNADGQRDIRLVSDASAPLLWARFYDLEEGRPFVCDRDGVPHRSLSEIGHERRNGYSWYGTQPQVVLDAYEQWRKRVAP